MGFTLSKGPACMGKIWVADMAYMRGIIVREIDA